MRRIEGFSPSYQCCVVVYSSRLLYLRTYLRVLLLPGDSVNQPHCR